jgi:hypothetical protein
LTISTAVTAGRATRYDEGEEALHMVSLYVAGEKVGTLADLERLLPELVAAGARVEFRDENGNSVGTFAAHRPPAPGEPLIPWEPDITREEIERRLAEPGLTIDEVRRRLGWA